MGDSAKAMSQNMTQPRPSIISTTPIPTVKHVHCCSSVTVNLQMEGNTSGDHSDRPAWVSRDISVAADGMVEATFGMQITGGLTEGTVT